MGRGLGANYKRLGPAEINGGDSGRIRRYIREAPWGRGEGRGSFKKAFRRSKQQRGFVQRDSKRAANCSFGVEMEHGK